ncbi:hypothetical protein E2I00_007456, partial [Balaenoptera physalus]
SQPLLPNKLTTDDEEKEDVGCQLEFTLEETWEHWRRSHGNIALWGGETRPGRGLGLGFLFGGVAYGSLLSRRRLATSRDMGWKMASPTEGADLEASLLSFEKLDRASPDLWPEQCVAEFAASFKSPITSSPPKWMAEIERDDIDMLKELGSLTTANLMEKVRGLQNLAYQLGLDEWK